MPENKARYLIETFQSNKDEIINIIVEIIASETFINSLYWQDVKKEVIKILQTNKK